MLTCAEKELGESEIMLATRMSRGLVRQYLNIIEDFKSKGCFPEELIAHQTKIESDYEQHLKDQMKP